MTPLAAVKVQGDFMSACHSKEIQMPFISRFTMRVLSRLDDAWRELPLKHSRNLIVLAMVFSASPVLAAQGDYCAFRVTVISPSRKPVSQVAVGMVQGEKKVFAEAVTDGEGIAELCDAPLGYVDIVVGNSQCGTAVVRNLRALWMETQTVSVIYQQYFCEGFVFPEACHITFRVQDEAGHPVAGARLRSASPGVDNDRASDQYGRIFQALQPGATIKGEVEKAGYGAAEVTRTCILREEPDFEVDLIVHPLRPR